jgi:hypothetical protein
MNLAQAIDDLIEFVEAPERVQCYRGKFCHGISQPERHQFDELDQRVYILALAARLKDELPKPVDIEGSMFVSDARPLGFLGKTHLPGDWIEGIFSFVGEERWKRDLLLVQSLAEAKRLNKGRRPGKPKKGETPADTLIIAALVKHHRYEPGGRVGNWMPATGKALSEMTKLGDQDGVSTNAISKFWRAEKRFGERGKNGYDAACRQKKIGRLLAAWQGDALESHEEYDDNRAPNRGHRHAGSPPGSRRDGD